MGASNLKLIFISSTWDCTTFHNFLRMFQKRKKNQKLAGLCLAGEVANHVGIYGSKAAEGLSVFQRRSSLVQNWNQIKNIHNDSIPVLESVIVINDYWSYDDVIQWKHFPLYWPFVWGIHRPPVNSPHKGQWRGALVFSLICLNKRLSKQWWDWWFETPSLSLWCHCNVK